MAEITWQDDEYGEIEIIEQNYEAAEKYGFYFGPGFYLLTPDHIAALQAGKMLAFNDGEYSTFLALKPAKDGN